MSSKASGSSARGPVDSTVKNLRAQAFFQGLASEMRRVTWPTRSEWISATLLTIGLVVCLGLYTYGVDTLCRFVFHFVHPMDQ
jgi:preprotein translocase SecE subunit